ncbi:MAG: ATP-dependent Clp protease adaptor ClpS [Candidatus Hydrogenedentes bacterium]|nr:ATP-dependent Clp protease adaptor ClpS [Candidatus Hydrogenedentota bacterium]MDK1020765.1 ATP-dependent Clp protease adaptor ClpS [Candidatus Hydrogenedentota bacterium]
MGDADPRTKESIAVKTEKKIQPPSMHKVLLHNDHYTTMEFVIDILESIFAKPGAEAVRIMLNVHEKGVGVAGVYTADIAETKIVSVRSRAQDQGFPLKCTMEPE